MTGPGDSDDGGLAQRLAALADPVGLLREIFARSPVGLQIFTRDGHCALVNAAHTELFGAVPPPTYSIFEDTILHERGVVDLVRRAFAGERIVLAPIWYDIRDLRNLGTEVDTRGGRRIAVGCELVPLRDAAGEVAHVLLVFNDATAAHEAREQAEAAAAAAEQRARQAMFLADASKLLSSSLDFEETLSQVARAATPALADFCLVDLVNDDGSFRRVAASHVDPAAQPILDELRARFPPHPRSPQPGARVIKSGLPELLPEVDAAVIGEHTRSVEHGALMQRLGVRSFLAVPIQLGARTLGAISLGYVGERRYTFADVALVEALASRAAVAIENARLYQVAGEARAEAEAANRAKDEFLAMLGHELRNPLAPIVTALELARAREPEAAGAAAFGRERAIIERQVEHLRRLVDDLLDVSRITRGALELDRRPLELADAVHEGVELARPLVTQRGHAIAVSVAPALTIYGDRVRLAQVVANLVTNAARYTDPGGRIAITGERREREIVLRVRDDGSGIPADLLPRIFDAFARGSRPIDRASGGLGIGLAIVRSLVALHGGRVSARSEGAGRGTEIEIVVPALEVSAPAPVARRSVPAPRAALARPRTCVVLVVDDNVDAAELLAEALALHGYQPVVAHDPLDALALAQRTPPRLALVDLGLPGIDGYELAQRLRAAPGLADLPIIAVTGFGQRSDRERTRAAGFVEHLVKPIRVEALLPVLANLLDEDPPPR